MADETPPKPRIPDIRIGSIPPEVLANLDPRSSPPAFSNGYNLPANISSDVSNFYHYLRGTTPQRVDPTAEEIIAKAKATYAISKSEEQLFISEYTNAQGAPDATQRLIQALSQTKAKLPEAEQAAEEKRKREQAAPSIAPRPAVPVVVPAVEDQAVVNARLAAEVERKHNEAARSAPAAPVAATLPPFYSYGEVRNILRNRDPANPLYQQITKELEDTFNARAANIRRSDNEFLIKKLNDSFEADKKSFILDGVERLERNIGGMPDNLPSQRARAIVAPVPPVPPVAAVASEATARVAAVADTGDAAETRRQAARVRQPEAIAPQVAVPIVSPPLAPELPATPAIPAVPQRQAEAPSRQYLPAFEQPVVPARAEQTPEQAREQARTPTMEPQRAVLPAAAQQRPTSVYDQFKENISRVVGNGGDGDVYRAAESFGRTHTAALRGKGLHIPPEERKKFQEFLFDYGYYQGARTRAQFVDGDFGPETHLAARNLQKTTFEAQQQLTAGGQGRKLKDGILGVETAKLFEQRSAAPTGA